MEEKDQRAYCTTFHINRASRAKTQGAVGPKGSAEGQTLLTVGAAGCTINRPNQSLPLRPYQKNGGIPKGAQPPLCVLLQLFSREKS